MTMEAQVIPLENEEAYSVQFFDGAGNTVSIYFHNPGPVTVTSDEAVTEALSRLLLLVGEKGMVPAINLS